MLAQNVAAETNKVRTLYGKINIKEGFVDTMRERNCFSKVNKVKSLNYSTIYKNKDFSLFELKAILRNLVLKTTKK